MFFLKDPSSTCDPFIDEHFRRSLGTDYDLIMRKKLEQEQKQRIKEEQQLLLQQQQAAAAAVALQAQQQQQQQNILKLKHHKKHQIHQHHQAMLNIQQQENQLPIPATPIQVPILPAQPQLTVPHPHSSPALPPQKQVIITQHTDTSESMSVDDHFAKALGETWTKIQNEGK